MTTIYDFHQLRENENGTFVVERKTCVNTTEPGQLPNLVETISTVVWSETKGAAETVSDQTTVDIVSTKFGN